MTSDESVIEFGGFRLTPSQRSLASADGKPIQLTRKLYDTLLFMVERPGRLLEKQTLLDAVWKGAVVEENTLSRTISTLRQILGERGGEHRYIETVSGVGYRFIAAVTGTGARVPVATRRAEPALAVLPFEDLSRERDQAYFADGVAEEVLNRLAGVKEVRLIAKSSSFRFRERAESAEAIGRSLGVDYLLVGSVRKEGARLRVTARLIDAATDSQRWSETFDRDFQLAHIFAIQDDIAHAVARALSATLGVGGAPGSTEGATSDLEAYDLFLRGRASADQSGAPAVIRGAELFRAAVTRDPKFTEAWQALAFANLGLLIFAPQSAKNAGAVVDECAARILELAPHRWDAHLVKGLSLYLRRDWIGVEAALRRAVELAHGTPWSLNRALGVFYGQIHEHGIAAEITRSGVSNDPLSLMQSGLYQIQVMNAGRLDEADAEYRRSLDLPGDREMAEHLVLHRLWARRAPRDEVFRARFRRYLDLTQTKPAPVLEEVYEAYNDAPRALGLLRAAAAAPEYQNPMRQLVVGWWLAAYDDVDASFATLWRSYVEMDHFNVSWLWFPVLARVRQHARFPELLERVGLARYWREKNRAGP